MGAEKGMITPAFDNAASRESYERAYEQLRASSSGLPCASLALSFLEVEAQLDAGMIEIKTAMLTSGLFSNDDEQALGKWIYRQHANLARIGARATSACAQDAGFDPSRTMRLLALTFLHWGEAAKWELMVGRHERRDYRLLHSLMKIAIEKGRQRESGELIVDGMRRWSSIEHLYFRLLILDRFTSGNLTRQQVEVLDAWLWEWAMALKGKPEFPGDLVLRADLDRDHGLRYGRRSDEGPSLYLQLAPLGERRNAIIKELHRGRIVPAQGRAAHIRVEAHVAVLLQLRALLAGEGGDAFPRAPRKDAAPARVELLLGLAEITRQLGAEQGSMAPAIAPVAAAPKAATTAGRVDYGSVYDKPRRLMTLKNSSATGYLFVASVQDAAGIEVGELMGVRMNPGEACVLARVVRRVQEQGDAIHLGMELVSDPATPIRLATLVAPDNTEETFLFVPGSDSSGRFDSFAVPYGALKDETRYRIRAGRAEFTLAFNRVHRRGRGWALAGFGILS